MATSDRTMVAIIFLSLRPELRQSVGETDLRKVHVLDQVSMGCAESQPIEAVRTDPLSDARDHPDRHARPCGAASRTRRRPIDATATLSAAGERTRKSKGSRASCSANQSRSSAWLRDRKSVV